MIYYNDDKKIMGNWISLDDMIILYEKLITEMITWIYIMIFPGNYLFTDS